MPFSSKHVVLISLVMASIQVDAAPQTDLYEITSGTFGQSGGTFGGGFSYLPAPGQAFIELTIDNELNVANMSILSMDLTRTFEGYGYGSPFVDGVILGNQIVFQGAISGYVGLGELDYNLLLFDDHIILNGSLLTDDPIIYDLPHSYSHSQVEATLVPEPCSLLFAVIGTAALIAGRRRKVVH